MKDKTVIYSILLIIFIYYSNSLKLPFDRCSLTQSNAKECLMAAALSASKLMKNGLPEFGMPPTDPLFVPEFTISNGNNGPISIVQKYINVTYLTLENCQMGDLEFNAKKKTFHFTYYCPALEINGDYQMTGKILLFPINGEGKMKIRLINVTLDESFKLDEYQKKGVTHYKFVDHKFISTPKLVKFEFENLFKGDKKLSDEILKVMNENWMELYQLGHQGYEEARARAMQQAVNQIFNKIPASEIFLE